MDCSRLKRGKFKYHSSVTGINYFIERNDSLQMETDESTGLSIELKITWTSPCSYDLTLAKILDSGTDTGYGKTPFSPVRTQILETAPAYYIFRATGGTLQDPLVDTIQIPK